MIFNFWYGFLQDAKKKLIIFILIQKFHSIIFAKSKLPFVETKQIYYEIINFLINQKLWKLVPSFCRFQEALFIGVIQTVLYYLTPYLRFIVSSSPSMQWVLYKDRGFHYISRTTSKFIFQFNNRKILNSYTSMKHNQFSSNLFSTFLIN